MRATFAVLALSCTLPLAMPASAQVSGQTDGSLTASTAPRQPTGAVVPNPAATSATAGTTTRIDAETPPGTVRSRDTAGMRQSPEALNAFGCKQIDPLCQGGR